MPDDLGSWDEEVARRLETPMSPGNRAIDKMVSTFKTTTRRDALLSEIHRDFPRIDISRGSDAFELAEKAVAEGVLTGEGTTWDKLLLQDPAWARMLGDYLNGEAFPPPVVVSVPQLTVEGGSPYRGGCRAIQPVLGFWQGIWAWFRAFMWWRSV